jgi:DNA helicase-2/ATP-dependent DNA helicase PcrA
MRIFADLHVHSRYSRATSPRLTPPRLERWARIKGIGLLGTGDCTHPAWLAELRDALEPAEDGFFQIKDEVRRDFDRGEALAEDLPDPSREYAARIDGARFVLTGEISTIYSRGGRTRKVHHLVILPGFEAATAFQARLEKVGNISSDGRPILGLDSRDLFAMLLDADERSILVPAHIWTPWFSALGARSGFDSIDECYRDLAPRIGAIETGLSSNPPMNWAVSSLDRFSIISNSDAHSPEKLGREATIIEMEPSFAALAEALAGGGPIANIVETVEFFPQEGKYHYDGHRACGVVRSPRESAAGEGLCPVCGKPLTSGVLGRVVELASRTVDESATCPEDYAGTNRRPYLSLIPLAELLAELLGTGPTSKKAAAAYGALIEKAGSEFSLLIDKSEAEIKSMSCSGLSGELLAAAIGRMRSGRVSITPGYDGEYGVIRAFAPGERIEAKAEAGLFGSLADGAQLGRGSEAPRRPKRADAVKEQRSVPPAGAAPERKPALFKLDPAQERAVNHPGGPALVVAGPGTGKTAVLALRVARLAQGSPGRPGLESSAILALTFTNKAAEELRGRIGGTLGARRAGKFTAATFHSFCRSILREKAAEASLPPGFGILDEEERYAILETIAGRAKARKLGAYIEERKRYLLLPGESAPRLGPGAPDGLPELAAELGLPPIDAELDAAYAAYRDALRKARALDFDDLVAGTVRLLSARPETLASLRDRFRAVFVDEYQDLNFAQYALVRILAPAASAELCVIGDPNQAIYGFRGSDRRFIDRFLADYPGAAVYRLVKSFRCAPSIIGAAGRLVGEELEGSGSAVSLSRSEYPTEKSEAEGIAREIDRLIGGTRFFAIDSGVADEQSPELRSLGECAILVRAAALAPAIEKALLDHGIPYRLIGERPWWEEGPARSILAVLRERRPELAPTEAVRFAIGLLAEKDSAFASLTDPEGTAGRLVSLASSYRDLASFLDALALGSPEDGYESRSERVALMTIHAAKGLEFDQVFVAGLEEGILPFTLFEGREGERDAPGLSERIEEEQRLLYVAMTRARVGLHLSWSRSRNFRGRDLALAPSRFLAQIEELVPMQDASPRRRRDPQLGLF